MTRQVLEDHRDRVVRSLLDRHWTQKEIKAVEHVGSDRIRAVASGIPLVHVKGRPKACTPEMVAFIDAKTANDARISDGQMQRMVQDEFDVTVSVSTIRRVRKKLGFEYRHPLVVQELTEAQRRQRFQFAKELLPYLENNPEPIIMSDECRFCDGPDNDMVHLRRGHWNETAIVRKGKYPASVMFWGAIGTDFKSDLVKCPNREDSDGYITVIDESQLVAQLDAKYGKYKYYLMQDGAPCHKSEQSLAALRSRVKILPGWPPNSPDLNPIEMIWGVIKRRLGAQRRLNPTLTLEEIVLLEWRYLEQDMINRLMADIPRRLKLVIQMKGDSISALLSSHMTEPPRELQPMIDSLPVPNMWTAEEENRIMALHRSLGNRWKQIAAGVGTDRDPSEVKNRIMARIQDDYNRQLARFEAERELAYATGMI